MRSSPPLPRVAGEWGPGQAGRGGLWQGGEVGFGRKPAAHSSLCLHAWFPCQGLDLNHLVSQRHLDQVSGEVEGVARRPESSVEARRGSQVEQCGGSLQDLTQVESMTTRASGRFIEAAEKGDGLRFWNQTSGFIPAVCY